MTLDERISRYLDTIEPAISGQGGHNQTFKVACALVNGFDLPDGEALHYLQQFNQTCQPAWTEGELRHKIRSARNARHDKPRGHLIGGNVAPVTTPKPVQVGPKLESATDATDVLDSYRVRARARARVCIRVESCRSIRSDSWTSEASGDLKPPSVDSLEPETNPTDLELLKRVGRDKDPMMILALKMFGGKVRSVRVASGEWVRRRDLEKRGAQ